MSRRVIFIIIGVFFAIAVGLMVFAFTATHERVEEEIDLGPEPEAMVNPMLAAENYFERLDIDVHTRPDPHETEWLDDTDVMVLDPEMAVYEHFRTHLFEEWLIEGGHLIVLDPSTTTDVEEAVVSELELELYVERENYNLDDAPDWPEDIAHRPQIIHTYEDVVAESPDYWADAEPIASYDPFRSPTEAWGPSHVDLIAATSDESPILMSGPHQRGRITVVSRSEWIMNSGLAVDGMGDVWADVLATGEEWPERATFFVHPHAESWMSRIWTAGWPFFAGLLLWLMFGFTRARRFGPTVPEPERKRQRRGDHIRAVGHFLWSHHGRDVLVDSTRRALVEALQKRRPSIKTMKPSQRYRVMAEELQIEARTLQTLLEGPVPRRQAEFQTLIARLETLRRKL